MRFLLLALLAVLSAQAQISFRLPTQNDNLFKERPADFYMYVDRFDEQGINTMPWEGGSYGVVRTLVMDKGKKVPCKFHEGIDVKPLQRDPRGIPLDEVYPAAPGTVVHVAPNNGDYGRYVVLRHHTAQGELYSLYAHLASTCVEVGEFVGTGNKLGVLGFSGDGLNCQRAHLHFEICLLINRDFDKLSASAGASRNKHGLYHGWNLCGMDAAALLLASRDGKSVDIGEFLRSQQVEYKVLVPNRGKLDIVERYPFLLDAASDARHPSWEISFSFAGVPLQVKSSEVVVGSASVSYLREDEKNPLYRTVRRVSQHGKQPVLTTSGRNYVQMLEALAPAPAGELAAKQQSDANAAPQPAAQHADADASAKQPALLPQSQQQPAAPL